MQQPSRNWPLLLLLLVIMVALFSPILFTTKIVRAPDILNEFYWGVYDAYGKPLWSLLRINLASAGWDPYINSGHTNDGGMVSMQFLYLYRLVFGLIPAPASVASEGCVGQRLALGVLPAASGAHPEGPHRQIENGARATGRSRGQVAGSLDESFAHDLLHHVTPAAPEGHILLGPCQGRAAAGHRRERTVRFIRPTRRPDGERRSSRSRPAEAQPPRPQPTSAHLPWQPRSSPRPSPWRIHSAGAAVRVSRSRRRTRPAPPPRTQPRGGSPPAAGRARRFRSPHPRQFRMDDPGTGTSPARPGNR